MGGSDFHVRVYAVDWSTSLVFEINIVGDSLDDCLCLLYTDYMFPLTFDLNKDNTYIVTIK